MTTLQSYQDNPGLIYNLAMRTKTAILLGKSIARLSKILKIGGGTAAPGLYALKVDPNLVSKLATKILRNIVITGTNGKTTTARMITHFAKECGLKVIRNHAGSNLERGIASTLVLNNFQADLGIWELDEAAFNTVAPKIKSDLVVILNVSRDQLDRYGEVDKVVADWCQTLKKLSKSTTLLINKDLSKLKSCFAGKTLKFSLPKDIKLNGLDGSTFSFIVNRKSLIVNLSLPGTYHIYDAIAALSVAGELKLPLKKCVQSLKTFRPAFGRVERFDWGYIFLIKNPAGATAVFETIRPILKPDDRLFLALNDNLADGTDVSWIWDADFEELKIENGKLKIICSGTRAYDLANRLKYADIPAEVEPDLKKAFREATSSLKGRLFVLPTYTAMLQFQKILKRHYWEEEQ